ncbi:MAG: MogA/MoaB family molybdenum cofactor biosynthesis protein [Planctomycetota bacterium]
MNPVIRYSVLTVSDRCAAGTREDLGGPAVVREMTDRFGAECVCREIVPDEPPLITQRLRAWLANPEHQDLIWTTGGTGLAPRDVTPEATAPVIERRHDALLELARRRCYDITPMTYLSRGIAGSTGQTLIINLPGSPRGVVEMLDALADVLPHAVETLRGDVIDNHPNQPRGMDDAKNDTPRR